VTRAAAVALAAALAAASAARAEDPATVLLGVLEVEGPPGLALDAPLRATLELNPGAAGKTATLRPWFPGARVAAGKVTVELPGRAPAAAGRPTAAQRRPSFLVDYDEPDAASFRDAVAALGPAPADDALAALVDGWIEHKDLSRRFDSAARVAARRQGDCTEHAVLLAAAARVAGRAARVVLGVALVSWDGQLRGFGHAWTEIHDGRAWHTVDGTRLPGTVRYLPLSAVSDESPSYLMTAWSGLSPLDVRRIALAPAAPAR
jgi:transglutaminase-like putative cysteine protease